MRKHRRKVEWKSADVKCPFYLESSGNELQCEGFTEGMTTMLCFRQKEERDSFMGKTCCGPYENCPMFREVTASKYAER